MNTFIFSGNRRATWATLCKDYYLIEKSRFCSPTIFERATFVPKRAKIMNRSGEIFIFRG